MYWSGRFLLFLIMLLLKLGTGEKQQVPYHDALPFRLCYNESNSLMVEFPSIPTLQGLSLSVSNIDKKSHILQVEDPENCLAILFLQRRLYNSSNIYPLEHHYPHTPPQHVTFFNCSSSVYHSCPIFALGSDEDVLSQPNLISCAMKSRLLSPIPVEDLMDSIPLTLKWTFQPKVDEPKTSRILRIVLSGTGSVVLVLLLVVCFFKCSYFKKKGDDQVKLEKFLKDYKALKPTRFSYVDIKRMTNNFRHKLGESAHGMVFIGKLSADHDIQVAVKVLNHSDNDGQDFINEMGTLGKIHHTNIVPLLGFSADDFHRALVYDFFLNSSLQKFISSLDD